MSKRMLYVLFAILAAAAFFSCSKDDPESSAEGLGRTEVEEIVTGTVIPSQVPAGDKYVCSRIAGTLTAGTVIEEDAPAGWQGSAGRAPAAAYEVAEESYFFYLDLAPATFYVHPVKYVVVSKASGQFDVIDASWWPKIAGTTPDHLLQAFPGENLVVEDNVDIQARTQDPMIFNFPPLVNQWSEGYIVVQGLMPTEGLYADATTTYENGYNFFIDYANAFSSVVGLTEGDAEDVFVAIDALVLDGKSMITLYIIAHGGVDHVKLSGGWVPVSDFRDKFAEYPTVMFNLLLGSCHAGSFIDDLETLPNMRVIMTACAADQGAQPDWDDVDGELDYNYWDSGSEWTSSILYAADIIVGYPGHWNVILDEAAENGIPVTCQLLSAVRYASLGAYPALGFDSDYDMSHRMDATDPQGYCSWEAPE